MGITRGDLVHATTASGDVVPMRALGSPQPGYNFEVLWVATEDDWEQAEQGGGNPHGIPWPVDYVQELANA